MATKQPDIVDVLAHWESADDVPEDLRDYLANAADEIRGLRYEIIAIRRLLKESEPYF